MTHLDTEAVLILDGQEIPLECSDPPIRLSDILAMRDKLIGNQIPLIDGCYELHFTTTLEEGAALHERLAEAARRSPPVRMMVTFSDGWVYDPFPRWLGRARRFESWREAGRRTRVASKRWRGDALRWER